jgi:hypothetical protein
MAGQKPKRRSRKRGNTTAPRAVPSQRREQSAEQRLRSEHQRRAGQRTLGTVGERPPSPFGGLPVSEIAILLGAVALIVGWIQGGGVALLVGLALVVLAVLEITAREHLSGYRSHATLLAAVPAVGIGLGLVTVSGEKAGDAPLLGVAIPIFLLLFWPLRKRFQTARQARIVRPPMA